ncbi:Uncharacterized protein BP5553_04048 [Venustampulla echinocandica]|uniref:DUF1308 domain-containing protein n=1 Tax=Venustampulla echinocandica TaxID=2656787 RepID=A0A370TW52_9HELO|nr:Uncharacterized protein BP5553_04048 [Venustampulla echinocandica]RDL39708.1 Uncharacterized protein BP5553_04048 [Venustampulla echinocandica]
MDGNVVMDTKIDPDISRNHNSLDRKMESLDLTDRRPFVACSATGSTEASSTPEASFEVDPEALALDMQQRCRLLLNELEQFQAYLKERNKANNVELRTFKGGLQAEMKLIHKLAKQESSDNNKTVHSLKSSNFLFYNAVWNTAKSCTGIIALSRRFYWTPGQKTPNINGKISKPGAKHRTCSALVDIVCQDGLEWVKVSSNTEKRIIWDLAKAGWVGVESSGEESEGDSDDPDEAEGLLKQVEALVKASRATRVRYRHPKVRLVLPRISSSPQTKEVAKVLQKIRNLGVTVQTSEEWPIGPPVATVLDSLIADRFETFTSVLNVDCTILLAFASDLSHGRVEPEDWHNQMISRQREMEAEEQLLPDSLWPACGSRKLVCTREAAVRMQEIVEVIGTTTEKKRVELLIDLSGDSQLTLEERLEEFQKLSDYEIPKTWLLPIEIVDVDIPVLIADLPPIAGKLADSLSTINKSVFLYGWASKTTTISSNRSVAKEVETTVEENRSSEEEIGPDIWLCSTTRSLVGKEKQRRGAHDRDSCETESNIE